MKKIAVIGASGFLGTAVVERLLSQGAEVVPFIHSSGNAWRLARLGFSLKPVDILSSEALGTALAGCTHVVNCSRGDTAVMLKGLRNLIMACSTNGVKRLVHISSVAVHGDPPHPQSTHEDAPTEPERNTYGWVKLQQDNLIRKACKRGLPAIVLCSPNMSGAFSGYLSRIVDACRRREFALLEGGNTHCSLVDVNNLSYAVELALEQGRPDGRRFFITDDEPSTWADALREIGPLLGTSVDLPQVERNQLASLQDGLRKPPIRIMRGLKHLMSREVRMTLRKDPFWEKIDIMMRKAIAPMGSVVEEKLRMSIEGPRPIDNGRRQRINIPLSAQQLRGVVHNCERAKRELGYTPLYSFSRSMAAYRRWYIQHHGLDTPYRDLILELHCGNVANFRSANLRGRDKV